MENIKTEEENSNNLNEMEIQPLVVSTFNKIAEWHNEDTSKAGLKHLSISLIEDIAGAVFQHLGLSYESKIKMDEELRNRIDKIKEENNEQYPSKKIEDMTYEELLEELEKKKRNP